MRIDTLTPYIFKVSEAVGGAERPKETVVAAAASADSSTEHLLDFLAKRRVKNTSLRADRLKKYKVGLEVFKKGKLLSKKI